MRHLEFLFTSFNELSNKILCFCADALSRGLGVMYENENDSDLGNPGIPGMSDQGGRLFGSTGQRILSASSLAFASIISLSSLA